MDPVELDGRWWTADAPDAQQVRGTLVANHHRIRVELDEPIAQWRQAGEQLVRDLGVTPYPVVHGQLADGRFVTLVDAETGLSILGPTTLRANYCLLGLFAVAVPKVSYAQIEFDWLDSWVDSGLFYDNVASPVHQVEIGTERLVETVVSEGVTVALASGMLGAADVRRVDLSRHSVFEIDFDEPCELDELISEHVRPLQDLVTLCLGRPIRVTAIRVAVPDPPLLGVLYDCLCPINQAADSGGDIGPALLQAYDAPTLVSAEQLIDRFGTLLPAWYTVRDHYAGAVIKTNAPSYARFMYLENKAAIAVQAIEALHDVRFGSQQLPADQHKKRRTAIADALAATDLPADWVDWAGRVLQGANYVPIVEQITHVLSLTGAFGDAVVTAMPKFAQGAATLRHLSSHGSGTTKRGGNGRGAVERDHFLVELVIWSLRIALLSLAGIPDIAESATSRHAVIHAMSRLTELGALPPKKAEGQAPPA